MGLIRQFLTDLVAALRVMVRQPALPILSAILFVGSTLALDLAESGLGCIGTEGGRCDPWSLALYFLVGVPLAIYSVGWFGTERIWYLRSFRADALTASEALRLTPRFIGPFLRLGILVLLFSIPVFIWASRSEDAELVLALAFLVGDVLLTFVTAALAYSTRRVRQAVRMGLRLIHDAWPASVNYVLLPPFVVWALNVYFEPVDSVAGTVATMTLMVWVSLWVKGAVARFYLRHREAADPAWGSAFAGPAPSVPPQADER